MKMADASLDEFFAKKDKSKKGKSGKSKYTTTETIAKKLEESGKKVETLTTPKKEKEKNNVVSDTQATLSLPLLEQDSDDWKDIEEEKEKDYSGLKVQSMCISEKEKEEEQLKEQQAEENGESSKLNDGVAGPWKMSASSGASSGASPASETIVVEEEVKEGKQPSTYVPPHLRYSSTSVGPKRNPKTAPEISSEVHFPSLSASVDSPKGVQTSTQDKNFQSVKHGIKSKDVSSQGLQLDLENKFAALHQGEYN
ncbi:protein CDV3 homolog [Centruroides sculpturatus]|uniref:protein CDV3 homolog n=1 Tax=Centruroides sculpturatus TaxID=218467 RepID=UPI000C6CE3AC|nr:protein CDV3 homolog [Centruroides sculpturatus]